MCVDHCDDEHSIVFGTIDDDSSHRLGKALTTGSKLAASFHRVRKGRTAVRHSAMPSVSRSTKRFSYLPATCTVRCSSPSPAANTDSCIRSTQNLIREITKLLGTIQTLKADTPLFAANLSHLPVLTVEFPV
jgi:hypothetical protein